MLNMSEEHVPEPCEKIVQTLYDGSTPKAAAEAAVIR